MSAVHASAVRIDEIGVLIRGASGSGKSRLAMALLEQTGAIGPTRLSTDEPQRPAERESLDQVPTALIGDDYLDITSTEAGLQASPAKGLQGLMEMRGLGILSMPWCADAPIHLAVDLIPLDAMERLPGASTIELKGHSLNHLNIPIGDLAQQVLMVRMALRTLLQAD